jgi:Domain of unknown function (DUF4384)
MRFKVIAFSLLAGVLMIVPCLAGAQDPEQDDVRGAFLTSRPKTADKPAKSSEPTRPTHHRKTVVDHGTKGGGGTTVVVSSKSRLGLGLTLFMRDSNGLAVRVDPNHEFQKGDQVRVLLETNADGHLYVFNTTDGGRPVMIYPDPQLDEAGNFIQAHVPFELPSSLSTEERLRWLTFDEHAGAERLYFVFTREPLQNVPIEEALVKYCSQDKKQCAWHPESDLWSGLQKEMESASRSNNAHKFGKAQTIAEQDAATRGIGLAREDPEPSMVIMTASSGPSLLVTALELLHK